MTQQKGSLRRRKRIKRQRRKHNKNHAETQHNVPEWIFFSTPGISWWRRLYNTVHTIHALSAVMGLHAFKTRLSSVLLSPNRPLMLPSGACHKRGIWSQGATNLCHFWREITKIKQYFYVIKLQQGVTVLLTSKGSFLWILHWFKMH